MHRYRTGVASALLVSSLLLSGATTQSCNTSNSNTSLGPSKGEVIGAAVGIVAGITLGTIILVEVHKSHHTVKGCVTTTADGLQVISDSDGKPYLLSGATTGLKVGDTVKLRGDKKKSKGTAESSFVVQSMNKDYGACKAQTAPPGQSATATPLPSPSPSPSIAGKE